MKKPVIALFTLLLVLGSFSTIQAQSRKALKEEVAKLQQEIVRLTQDLTTAEAQVDQLQQENQRYAEQNAAMSTQVTQLQQDNLALSQQYQQVLKDYESLQGGSGTGTFPGTSGGTGTSAGTTAPPTSGTASDDSRKCAYYQNKLTPNTSYTEYFNVLQSDGFGIQVFSSKSLCQAAEYAETFKKDFQLYKTYIRCKQIGGGQMYAVIYGSLKDKQQTQTYLNNLKQKYSSKFKGSFVVQH
ncbi:MAG: SPOR domain-containing protein [Bacteroidia bacterium]